MPTPMATPPPPPDVHRLRAGTAARLAGLPVTTLRVWERRYGVVDAAKAASGQRLYSTHDVARLRLLRQLTRAGHAIGTIASLQLEALQALVEEAAPSVERPARSPIGVVAVGRSAAQALSDEPACVLRRAHDDLDAAEAAPPPADAVDVLVVRLASLQPAAVDRVLALGARLAARTVFVVYAFGTEASARALREAGARVHREPVTGRELAQWVRRRAESPAPPSPTGIPWPVEPRRYSDAALARLAELPSAIACECQRHLAELVAQLAGFERYSHDCVSTGPADADLHRRLARTAGAARTLFEQALADVVSDAAPGADDAHAR